MAEKGKGQILFRGDPELEERLKRKFGAENVHAEGDGKPDKNRRDKKRGQRPTRVETLLPTQEVRKEELVVEKKATTQATQATQNARPATTPAPAARPQTVTARPQNARPAAATAPTNNMEPCPLCGNDKYKTVTFEEKGARVTRPILVCASCTTLYKKYQEDTKAANVRLVASNTDAPEPEGPMGKFQWFLGQVDLVEFELTAKTAEAAYRAEYEEVVLAVLKQRGYLNGTPSWKGTATSRPVMRLTDASYKSGMGEGLRKALEEKVQALRWTMKRAVARLETAPRAKAEIEAKLAANGKGTAETQKAQATAEAEA